MKKKILGTSDGWSTSRLSHQPSKPAYYIVDCRILEHWDDGNDLILSRCHLSLLLPSLAYYFPFALELIKNRESESKRQHSETNCREKHKLKHFCMKEMLLGGIFWEEYAGAQASYCGNLLKGLDWKKSSGRNLLRGI